MDVKLFGLVSREVQFPFNVKFSPSSSTECKGSKLLFGQITHRDHSRTGGKSSKLSFEANAKYDTQVQLRRVVLCCRAEVLHEGVDSHQHVGEAGQYVDVQSGTPWQSPSDFNLRRTVQDVHLSAGRALSNRWHNRPHPMCTGAGLAHVGGMWSCSNLSGKGKGLFWYTKPVVNLVKMASSGTYAPCSKLSSQKNGLFRHTCPM